MADFLKSFRIAVLASTRGTDLQAIIDEIKKGMLKVELACVVSNMKDCYALERARAQGFKTFFVDPEGKSREEFDQAMLEILDRENVDLIVLVGYMRILTPAFVERYRDRIINVHPALLPKYGGAKFYDRNVHQAVLASGEKETGMTIHFVTEKVDAGKIILQKRCPVYPDDTPHSLKVRVQCLEKEFYPKVIAMLAAQGKK